MSSPQDGHLRLRTTLPSKPAWQDFQNA